MVTRGKQIWVALGLLALALFCGWVERQDDGANVSPESVVEHLYRAHQSGVVIEEAAVVSRLLPDDLEGSRHQRFIVRLDSGHTLLVSHNVDLAKRVSDLKPGDGVVFRGQYEWNERGGLVHWTHHDPQGKRPGGWLQHNGRTYR
jgi:hypothetical protein